MRKRFERQLKLGQTPIEQVQIPLKMRDELPPVLAALQWIYATPETNEQVFQLLETKMIAGKKKTGRPGMDLWHVLVLGLVRLALDCNYDRLEYLAHYDKLMRKIMGLESDFSGEFSKGFHQKTISQNVCHVDDELLAQINEIVAKAGRKILKKNENEKIAAKTDTYVLESNVHFPTDLNLLWDAARKCIRLLSRLCEETGLPGWRKNCNWEQQIKGLMRLCGRLNRAGGPNKEVRLEAVVRKYLNKAFQLEAKIFESIKQLQVTRLSPPQFAEFLTIQYFHDMLIKHIDLVDRRLLKNEVIPHEEKLFSLFEPFTEWITKGKMKPSVELGLKLLVTTDQYGIVIDYKVMQQSVDSAEVLVLIDRLINRFGENSFSSISFDKGFSVEAYRELIALYIPDVIMPKKGRLNSEEKAHEGTRKFKTLRHKHSAIESNINGLEHHGLNRCPDKGLRGFKRYAGFGVLAYNLHKIGNHLLAERWKRSFKESPRQRAA